MNRKTSRSTRASKSSRVSRSSGKSIDDEYDLMSKTRRYTTLGACDRIDLPSKVLKELHDIGQKSSEWCRELGGYVRLDNMKIEWERGLPGTGKASFVPSEASLSKRNVIRFHCHPLRSFETPPSYQDLVQLCKDYVQHHDGIIEHIIITPEGFYLMCIPSKIVHYLDRFISALPPRSRASGIKRKRAFMTSRLFTAIERFCKKIKKYQECDEFDHTCIRAFIKSMKEHFGLHLQYRKYMKNMKLKVCRLGGNKRSDIQKRSKSISHK